MTIELISSSTLKITLTKNDMAEYNISYQLLDKKSPETKQFLMDIIDIVKEEKEIDLCSEKLYIEAFPQTNGGCLLYISILNERMKQKKDIICEIICETTNYVDLISLCANFKTILEKTVIKSQLYFNDKKYRLILTYLSTSEKIISNILDENQISWEKSEIIAESTKEYFELIVENNAILLLSELL